MKRYFAFLLAALLCFCACTSLIEGSDDEFQGVIEINPADSTQISNLPSGLSSLSTPMGLISLSVGDSTFVGNVSFSVGKSGGKVTFTAFYPEDLQTPLNDEYIANVESPSGLNAAPYTITREKIDERNTRYTVTIDENKTGELVYFYVLVIDYSRTRESAGKKIPVTSWGLVRFLQAAE